jgi:hypothetical protein
MSRCALHLQDFGRLLQPGVSLADGFSPSNRPTVLELRCADEFRTDVLNSLI